MKKIKIIVLFSFFGFILVYSYKGQSTNRVNKGDRVKISAPNVAHKSIVGTVADISSYGVIMRSKDSVLVVPHTAINEVKLSVGRKRNTVNGAIIGGVTGALIVGATSASSVQSCSGDGEWCFEGLTIIAGTTGCLLAGGLLGGLIGTFVKSDRWKKVPVSFSMKMQKVTRDEWALQPVFSVKFSLSK